MTTSFICDDRERRHAASPAAMSEVRPDVAALLLYGAASAAERLLALSPHLRLCRATLPRLVPRKHPFSKCCRY